MKRVTLLSICVSFSLVATVITRDGMISTASQYVPISCWTPVVDSTAEVSPTWHSWYKTKANGGYPPYDKLAYCWGGFDTPSGFKSRVENKTSPVPAGGYNTSNYSYPRPYIAGIDCSGFVLRCWGISTYTTYQQLIDYSLQIDKTALKKGDLLRKTGHSVLYMSGSFPGKCNIYESQADSSTGAHYPGVVHHSRHISEDDYTSRSIFPQFSQESPANGEVVEHAQTKDISVTIAAKGNIVRNGVSMGINGKQVSNLILEHPTDTTWKVRAPNFDVSEGRAFNVVVNARNDVARSWSDKYEK